jgi:hypothetical protein
MILNREEIEKLLEPSTWYPSGDNSQPWNFIWAKQELQILHDSPRAAHPLNAGNIASLLSLGSLIEAISINAWNFFQLSTKVEFGDHSSGDSLPWARVRFEKIAASLEPGQFALNHAADPLGEFIKSRATDRRLFKQGTLPQAAIEKAIRASRDLGQARCHMLTFGSPPSAVTAEEAPGTVSETLIKYIVDSEKLMMDHPEILPKVLQWTRFSQRAAQLSRDGLSLKNMGIRFWEAPALQLIKNYPPVLQWLKGAMIPQHMARVRKQLESSAGLVCVSLPKNMMSETPGAGRLMYRVWLELARNGFGVQPLTIASTLAYAAQEGVLNKSTFKGWIEFFENGATVLQHAFAIPAGREVVWMFRTGLSPELPEAMRTLRRPISEVLKIG